MSSENKTSSTIHLIVRNESFELPRNLFEQLVKYSSSSVYDSTVENESGIYLDVDPSIFNAYLLFIQSGCFIRPRSRSQEDLIDGLHRCGASSALITHYQFDDLISALSSHQYSSHRKSQIQFNTLILLGLLITGCSLTIDLYRQILILNNNINQERSQVLILIIYFVDGILFLYSSRDAISKFMSSASEENRLKKYSDTIIDMISSFGILCYFITQRPITNVDFTDWNFLWIFIHLCRTTRLIQIGCRLIDVRWCFYATFQCFWTFLQTLTGLFWIFVLSGSILYTVDMFEAHRQYSNMYSTILSTHETLYTIGYRNNAPVGYLTRLWTMISIYLMSSLVQILLWWFENKVMLQWKKLIK